MATDSEVLENQMTSYLRKKKVDFNLAVYDSVVKNLRNYEFLYSNESYRMNLYIETTVKMMNSKKLVVLVNGESDADFFTLAENLEESVRILNEMGLRNVKRWNVEKNIYESV